jgi:heat shock protein HslJ
MQRFHVIATVSGLLLTGALFIGCELIGEDKEVAKVDLAGTEWRLESFVIRGNVEPVEAGQIYTLSFSDSIVSSKAYCNTCRGQYWLSSPDSIRIVVACTRAVCSRATEFEVALLKAQRFKSINKNLILYYADFFNNNDTSELVFVNDQ